ncbi:hypothetical protein Tsubulata_032968 [Turnera subulata]|uniref:Uncharacterized protein n=1 Tax=Turnera subulata TaxID=218843 RepID=A0A9Q0F9L8_9ROSI|nr:hypothetical protein Tsubulata_032968 [Turnera subulata]
MGLKESSYTTIPPLLLRNLVTGIFFYADKSLLNLSERYKLLEHIRYLLSSSFVFFLRILPSLFPSLIPGDPEHNPPEKDHSYAPACGGGNGTTPDSGISRALSQLLSIVNDIPVSSRKYEVVRSLAETLIDENNEENVEALREVNRSVLSAAFARTLSQLEAGMGELGYDQAENTGSGPVPGIFRLNRVLKAVRSVGEGTWTWAGKGRVVGLNRSRNSAEKLAAELLWLAQKLAACGYVEEAVLRWASASNLAWLALSAEPRLQGSLVKASAFLMKQAKDLGLEETEEAKKEQQRRTKMRMLMSWLPLLCCASNGTDVPVLSTSERAELQKILEEIIGRLEQEEQEQVLSLWLHHYTYCSSSDWPNLNASYARWSNASRKLLVLQAKKSS